MAASPITAASPTVASPMPLAMKTPSEAAGTPVPTGTTSGLTSREWVIPPRPKPGRKPATDTPATKRKAQNRAAQRAFRERRAARVGELEEQMEAMEDKFAADQEMMQARITTLQSDVESYRVQLYSWQAKCKDLERSLENEKVLRARAELDLAQSRQKIDDSSTQAVPLRRASTRRQKENREPVQELDVHGCGNCTVDSRCQCVEEVLNMDSNDEPTQDHATAKRPHSPENSLPNIKRFQASRELRSMKADPAQLETDFTNAFSPARTVSLQRQTSPEATVSPLAASESCGFCQDGTPCVCAQLENETSSNLPEDNRLAPLLSQFTPPPSEGDSQSLSASGDTKPQPLHPSIRRPINPNPCVNGPGTCAQCVADPNSTIFCKSLAAIRSFPGRGGANANAGCCGGSGRGMSGCCRSDAKASNDAPDKSTLSCADAYTTLSRHPYYSEATEELDTWLGHLQTQDSKRDERDKDRPPMEVEAASVMGVLKMFDRRFGRE